MESQTSSIPAINKPQQNSSDFENQEKSKKLLLIILGVLEMLFPTFGLLSVIPLITLQNSLDNSSSFPYIGSVFFSLAILIAVSQIIVGLFSYDLKLGNRKTNLLIILGIIFAVLSIPAILLFVVMPIYGSLGNF